MGVSADRPWRFSVGSMSREKQANCSFIKTVWKQLLFCSTLSGRYFALGWGFMFIFESGCAYWCRDERLLHETSFRPGFSWHSREKKRCLQSTVSIILVWLKVQTWRVRNLVVLAYSGPEYLLVIVNVSQARCIFAARSTRNSSIHSTACGNPLFCMRSAGEGVPWEVRVCVYVCVFAGVSERFSLLGPTNSGEPGCSVRSSGLWCGVRGQALVNAVLNCLSLEICPHRDTWERWEGHAVRKRVKEVDWSLKEAHVRPVNMPTMPSPHLHPLWQWTVFHWVSYFLLGSLTIYYDCFLCNWFANIYAPCPIIHIAYSYVSEGNCTFTHCSHYSVEVLHFIF